MIYKSCTEVLSRKNRSQHPWIGSDGTWSNWKMSQTCPRLVLWPLFGTIFCFNQTDHLWFTRAVLKYWVGKTGHNTLDLGQLGHDLTGKCTRRVPDLCCDHFLVIYKSSTEVQSHNTLDAGQLGHDMSGKCTRRVPDLCFWHFKWFLALFWPVVTCCDLFA